MKTIIVMAFHWALLLLLSGCSTQTQYVEEKDKTVPAVVTGTIILPPAQPIERDNGFLIPHWSEKDQKWGYFSPGKNKTALPPQFDHAGTFQNGFAIALKKEEKSIGIYRISTRKVEGEDIVESINVANIDYLFCMVKRMANSIFVQDSKGGILYNDYGKLLGQKQLAPDEYTIWRLRDELICYHTVHEYLFVDLNHRTTLRLDRERYSIKELDMVSINYPHLAFFIPVVDLKTGKETLYDPRTGKKPKTNWDKVEFACADSIFQATLSKRNYLVKWPDEILLELPDSTNIEGNCPLIDPETGTIRISNESYKWEFDRALFQPETKTLLHQNNTPYRIAPGLYAAESNKYLTLYDHEGNPIHQPPSGFPEKFEGFVSQHYDGHPLFRVLDTEHDTEGVFSAEGNMIVPAEFDKIDFGAQRWLTDFPYIVAERDANSDDPDKEVWVFGPDGDTLAGPMTVTRWQHGSAYSFRSDYRHQLNSEDWSGTPKEEMLVYIEWMDSVPHKGYIDLYGHLYKSD